MPGKTWTLYLIFCAATERSYVGVTSLEDPLKRLEQHASKETNPELFRDLRVDRDRMAFKFFELAHFSAEAPAYEAERATITALVHIVGPYGVYNRREGGKPRGVAGALVLPRVIRPPLFSRTAQEMRDKTLGFRGTKATKKAAQKAWRAREDDKAARDKRTRSREPRAVQGPRPSTPPLDQGPWGSTLPRKPPLSFLRPGVVTRTRDPGSERSD